MNTVYGVARAPIVAGYPFGQPIDETGAGTGFPLAEEWVQDVQGFLQALLQEGAPSVPDGVAESTVASQYMAKFNALFQPLGQSLPSSTRIDGLRMVWDSTTAFTTNTGAARNAGDTKDLLATAALQKLVNATWVQGNIQGVVPDAISTPLADGWYRVFVVNTPVGVGDITIDSVSNAANFFADVNAIAAGFTDATLFRRIGWVRMESAAIRKFATTESDPRRFTWDVTSHDVNSVAIGLVSRTGLVLARVPPDAFSRVSMAAFTTSAVTSGVVLITEQEQADTAAAFSASTLGAISLSAPATVPSDHVHGEWKVDSSSNLYARAGIAGTSLDMWVDGWRDPAIAP
ncbi:MAG: hypothetical protein V3W41_14510 [Planctomycetota bacterium]